MARLSLCASTGEGFVAVIPLGSPSNADTAFPLLQYYEMSYGLNIEMHKQVRLGGMGAIVLALSFWLYHPCPHLALWALQGHPFPWEVAPCCNPGKAGSLLHASGALHHVLGLSP